MHPVGKLIHYLQIQVCVIIPTLLFRMCNTFFENRCVGCHAYGGEAVASGDFSSYQGVEAVLNADQSTFLSQIRWEMSDLDYNMPPTEKMSNEDIQKLECWIEAGYPQ